MVRKYLRIINQQLLPIFFYIKENEICPADISKNNSNCEKQMILLMIPNEEKERWPYLASKIYLYY